MRSFGRRIRPGVGLLRGTIQTIWIARAPLRAAATTAVAATAVAIKAVATAAGYAARRPPNLAALCPPYRFIAHMWPRITSDGAASADLKQVGCRA